MNEQYEEINVAKMLHKANFFQNDSAPSRSADVNLSQEIISDKQHENNY